MQKEGIVSRKMLRCPAEQWVDESITFETENTEGVKEYHIFGLRHGKSLFQMWVLIIQLQLNQTHWRNTKSSHNTKKWYLGRGEPGQPRDPGRGIQWPSKLWHWLNSVQQFPVSVFLKCKCQIWEERIWLAQIRAKAHSSPVSRETGPQTTKYGHSSLIHIAWLHFSENTVTGARERHSKCLLCVCMYLYIYYKYIYTQSHLTFTTILWDWFCYNHVTAKDIKPREVNQPPRPHW